MTISRSSKSPTPGPIIYFALQNGGRRPTSFTPNHRDQLNRLVGASLAACPSSRIHAFSWTSNEIRIALEAGGALKQFVREMSILHRKHIHSEICGRECLFGRGYGGTPIEGERELLHVVEHIHNAPVRAGLARRAVDYQWSSCRAYLGLDRIPWLTTSVVSKLLHGARRPGSPHAPQAGFNELAEAFPGPA